MSQRKQNRVSSESKQGSSGASSLLRGVGAVIGAILLGIVALLSGTGGDGTIQNNPTAVVGVNVTNTPRGPSTPVPATQVPSTQIASNLVNARPVRVGQGFGYRWEFWQIYFTAPTGSRNSRDYVGGIDENLTAAIDGVSNTLDIVAYEFNSPAITQAVLRAVQRGVQVRMVADTQAGINDEDSTIHQLIEAGVSVVGDQRQALMHNKFMILDGSVV
jgi:phosphatidylserine/phosphatidylglycerophosphate/cardiolipin synthase-like enzyme